MLIFVGPTPAIARVMEFDRLTVDGVNRATRTSMIAAGKAVNAARAAKTAGAAEIIICGFSGGISGEELARGTLAAGITPRFTLVEPPTRVCVTVIDHANHTATELVEESARVNPTDYNSLMADVASTLQSYPTGTLIVSGSLTPEAPTDFYAQCVRLANTRSWMSIVDASGDPLRLAIAQKPTWIKPNSGELAKALSFDENSQTDFVKHLRLLSSNGTRCLLTCGAEPAFLAVDGNLWRITVPKVKVVSAIGSGDSVTGVLAASLAAGKSPEESAMLALAAGVANVQTPLPALFTPVAMTDLLKQIQSEKI